MDVRIQKNPIFTPFIGILLKIKLFWIMRTIIYKLLFALAIISLCSCAPTSKESATPPANLESDGSDSGVDYSANAGTYTYEWQGSKENISEDFGVPNSGGSSITIEKVVGSEFRCCVKVWESYHACEEWVVASGKFNNIRQARVEFEDLWGEGTVGAVLEFYGDSIVVRDHDIVLCPTGVLNDVLYRSEPQSCE